MKYTIEGIDKSKIIKSTQIVATSGKIDGAKSDKAIMVNYLDGTQDVFEATKENLDRIIEIAESQAEIYVENKDEKIFTFKIAKFAIILLNAIILLFALLQSTPVLIGTISVSSILIATIISLSNRKIKYIKKYDLYVKDIKNKLESYKEIITKENSLTKSKSKKQASPKLENVLDLDKVSLKDLEDINNKVERYNEIEGKSPKKKSL